MAIRHSYLTPNQIERSYNLRARLEAFPATIEEKKKILDKMRQILNLSVAGMNNKISGRTPLYTKESQRLAEFFCLTMDEFCNPKHPITQVKVSKNHTQLNMFSP